MGSGGAARNNGWNSAAKLCDLCKYAPALVFCKLESTFMCMACDAKLHDLKHERVWICQVCEQAPAVVTCKADAAAMCVSCDGDIHSANPLARRHERLPAFPLYDTAEAVMMKDSIISDDDFLSNSWNLIVSYSKLSAEAESVPPEFIFRPDHNEFLDLEAYQTSYSDRVVPVQTTIEEPPVNMFHVDFTRSTFHSYINAASLSRSISSSSLEVGVVPDSSSLSEMSRSSVIGMTREERVLRYREKKKNRKFEKTIRYASRKAYAETRPRIKGRFAKRAEVDSDIDSFFISTAKYGVVPTF